MIALVHIVPARIWLREIASVKHSTGDVARTVATTDINTLLQTTIPKTSFYYDYQSDYISVTDHFPCSSARDEPSYKGIAM